MHLHNERCASVLTKAGVPNLSTSVYPFSVSIDERVPLNMDAGGILSRKGPIVDFLGVGLKCFCRVAKNGKIKFSPLDTKKTTFFCKNWWENVKFQNLGASLASTSEANAPEISIMKRLRKITKIYLPIHMQWFLKIIFNYFNFNILIFEPDMKSIEHKHALSAQHRLILTDTEHFVSALVVGSQEYRYFFANL